MTRAVEERQAQYLAQAACVSLEEVLKWPVYRRAWNNVIATIGPVL